MDSEATLDLFTLALGVLTLALAARLLWRAYLAPRDPRRAQARQQRRCRLLQLWRTLRRPHNPRHPHPGA